MSPDNWIWSGWIPHDNSGIPRGLEPDEVVQTLTSARGIGPARAAINIDWQSTVDPVYCYRRRIWATYSVGRPAAPRSD